MRTPREEPSKTARRAPDRWEAVVAIAIAAVTAVSVTCVATAPAGAQAPPTADPPTAATTPAAAGAPTAGDANGRRVAVSFGFDMATWSIDVPGLDRYTETVLPLAVVVPVGERLTLDVGARPFRSKLSPAFGSIDAVSHFSDTRVRASYRLGRDAVMLVGSVGAPTGLAKLEDADEIENAAFAADRRFANPVPCFGTGLVVNGSVAVARPLGPWAIGAGVGYSYRAEYDVADTLAQFDPGDELNLTFGVDRSFRIGGRPAQITADAVYTLYSDDRQSGATIFEVGDKLFLEGRGLMSTEHVDPWILSARFRSRAGSKLHEAAAGGGAQADTVQTVETGNELELQLTARFPASDVLAIDVSGIARLFGDVNGRGDATLFGAGLGIRSQLRPNVFFQPAVLFQFGDVDDVNVTGVRVQIGITIRS